jgi:hypothetical protein
MALSDRIDRRPAQEPEPAARPAPSAPEKEPIDRALLVVAGVVVLGAVMSILDTTVVNGHQHAGRGVPHHSADHPVGGDGLHPRARHRDPAPAGSPIASGPSVST